MNVCKRFRCNTCAEIIDCRIGLSNRDKQPFQFACPECEETISFTLGTPNFNLKGAFEIEDFDGPFNGEFSFVDLHLDLPVRFGEYEIGKTPYLQAIKSIGRERFGYLSHKLDALNKTYVLRNKLRSLVVQYKRNNIKVFERVCSQIPLFELKSTKKQDIIAALYTATSIMSYPFTVHGHNEELSTIIPKILLSLHRDNNEKMSQFLSFINDTGFLKTLHFDSISLYPDILDLELPLRPTLYFDYADISNLNKVPVRVSSSSLEKCAKCYQDLAEVFSRQLVLVAALNNLIKRGDYNLFEDSVRLNKKGDVIKSLSSLEKFADVDLGKKIDVLSDCFYTIDSGSLDNKLRNSIAHYKYEYNSSTQEIIYYPKKEGMKREQYYSLYFIEFMRKTLLLFREVHSINHIIKAFLYHDIFVTCDSNKT